MSGHRRRHPAEGDCRLARPTATMIDPGWHATIRCAASTNLCHQFCRPKRKGCEVARPKYFRKEPKTRRRSGVVVWRSQCRKPPRIWSALGVSLAPSVWEHVDCGPGRPQSSRPMPREPKVPNRLVTMHTSVLRSASRSQPVHSDVACVASRYATNKNRKPLLMQRQQQLKSSGPHNRATRGCQSVFHRRGECNHFN